MKKYNTLNGIRAIACIGILMMHVLINGNYRINSILASIIQSFTEFIYIFIIISSFSMCCGYYQKIKDHKISLEQFYIKRIKKIFPFFVFLIIIDIIYNHNFESLIEGFANITMMFNFVPQEIKVVGVGWFLGLIFVFYMIFPFFVFLFSTKKRGWIVTISAYFMNLISVSYFGIGRANMFYSFVYFCIGGLIYLYKEKIGNCIKNKTIYFAIFLASLLIYYILPTNKYFVNSIFILLFGSLMCYSLSTNTKVLDNKVTSFISNISFEIYLSHMFVFRVIEKLNLTNIFDNVYLSYISSCCMCFIGTIVLANIFNKFLENFNKKIVKEL